MRPIEPELQLISIEQEAPIPLDISDIIAICREYSKLGYSMQKQVDAITELGIQDALKTNAVSVSSLPHIKFWLQQVIRNPLFGDAGDQAADVVRAIELFQEQHPTHSTMN
jgi:hypothetical protein